MNDRLAAPGSSTSMRVDVAEPNVPSQKGWLRCEIGANVSFNTEKMESYFFARWEPVLYDALLVAAAVEFCDKTFRRPSLTWGRKFDLRIPVHEPDRWNQGNVIPLLQDALNFLTGDYWQISCRARKRSEPTPRQGLMELGQDVAAVMPFSDGLDSRAVAGLLSLELGDRLVRVRFGSKRFEGAGGSLRPEPFTSVPYQVQAGERVFTESSARSRGFKFSLLSALAAYLANAARVIVPESGQGALGPTLVPVGQVYVDYRSHPLFTNRMERFVVALLGYEVKFEFPQLWNTKGETLNRFVSKCKGGAASLLLTWSCWQQNRQVSVNHKKRQCGVCAACILRRMSMHAAGISEPRATYVWENLEARTFKGGAAKAFPRSKITAALHQYAIAGALHLDHLADLRNSPANVPNLTLSVAQLSRVCGLDEIEVKARLDRMLRQHEIEWNNFTKSLGPSSFVSNWVAFAA